MPLPDLFTPQDAEKIATFGGENTGKTAQLNYDVALPGAYSWGRVVPLELDRDAFGDQAAAAGTSLLELGVVTGDQGVLRGINSERLADFYRRALPATSRPSLQHVARVGGDVEPLLSQIGDRKVALAGAVTDGVDLLGRRAILAEPDDVPRQRARIDSYIDGLASRESSAPVLDRGRTLVTLPMPGLGQSIHHVPIDPVAPALPRIAVLETWELRSYLGDYGLGRTLQTFSLLPGERTTITLSTWRTEAATREDASSIFDSSDTAAQTRFSSSLADSSGSASQDQGVGQPRCRPVFQRVLRCLGWCPVPRR